MTRTVLAAAAVLAATAGATAQNEDPAFDVVSIKRNTSLATGGGMRPQPGGRITATNLPVRSLIGMAYGIATLNRILGLPDWAAEERYNIDAQAPQPNPSAEDLNAMMRTLLRERFGLVARRETRELPVYSLVQTRQGVLGSNLRAAAVDCADPDARKRAAATAAAGSIGGCGFRDAGGRLEGRGLSIDTLAQILVGPSGRPVMNRTGLAGTFDVDLVWAVTLEATNAVSIFTAVQEQLGLRLQNDTAPLDVVVVEKIQRPTEN